VQSVVEGSICERLMSEWKQKTVLNFDPSNSLQLGNVYVSNFMQRFPQLFLTAVFTQEAIRIEWTAYQNFRIMYDNVYQAWIDAGVAQQLPGPVWMDGDGNVVKTENTRSKFRIMYDNVYQAWIDAAWHSDYHDPYGWTEMATLSKPKTRPLDSRSKLTCCTRMK
jgi:hypothetical protein